MQPRPRSRPPPPSSTPQARQESGEPDPRTVAFILRLVRALHSYGVSAQRLEDLIEVIAARLGLHGAQFFSTPTSIMASFGPLGLQRTHMLRVRPGEVDLGKLAEVEHVAIQVATGTTPPVDGSDALERIAAAPPRYGTALTVAAIGIVSGAACQFLGGGWREIAVAAVLGLGLGFFGIVSGERPRLGNVYEPLGAFLVSVGAVAFAHLAGPLSVLTATLGGLIVLIPGLTLTTALTELATRHLASGTARLSGAFITFLSIAFGVALGNQVGAALLGAPAAVTPEALAGWPQVAAMIIAPLGFTVLFRAEPRDAPWIVATGLFGVQAGRFGASLLGVELGAFAGAFAVGLASAAYERWTRRPTAVVMVPGLLLLVPGTVGFRSLTSLMERHAVAGIETAFSAVITAVSLVAGLLLAGVVAPERRIRELDRRTERAAAG